MRKTPDGTLALVTVRAGSAIVVSSCAVAFQAFAQIRRLHVLQSIGLPPSREIHGRYDLRQGLIAAGISGDPKVIQGRIVGTIVGQTRLIRKIFIDELDEARLTPTKMVFGEKDLVAGKI